MGVCNADSVWTLTQCDMVCHSPADVSCLRVSQHEVCVECVCVRLSLMSIKMC